MALIISQISFAQERYIDNIFTIDSAAWATNAISVHSSLTDVKSAQELLAGNLGVQTGLNVSGKISVNVSYATATAIDPSITSISNQDLILEIDPIFQLIRCNYCCWIFFSSTVTCPSIIIHRFK